MVWHSYMLNPRKYLEDAHRYAKMVFWETNLPWLAIDASINSETFEYQPHEQSRSLFETRTRLSWDNAADLHNPVIECPRCYKELDVSWTGCNHKSDWSINQPDPLGTGLADKSFRTQCLKCDMSIDHEILRAQKFRQHITALQVDNVPMAGTYLGAKGMNSP